MLHSIPSTGIPDIDDQHRTIDNLITLYCNTISPNDEELCLTALSKAVNSHFQFVENFFDVKFPEELKARQVEILAWLSEKIRQRSEGDLSRDELARDLRQMFLANAIAVGEKLHTLD